MIGYDPLNEPIPANVYNDLTLLIPGKLDKTLLAPLMTRVFNEAYIPAANDKIMMFEPAQFPDNFFGFVSSVGY